MSSFILTIEWEHKRFQFDIAPEETVWDLKHLIYTDTDVEPYRQIFANLFLSANAMEDECTIEQLNLKPNFIVKVNDVISDHNGRIKIISKPRPGKKLLILDLDQNIRDCAALNGTIAVRPYLIEFLTSIYDDYDIGIWSAADMIILENYINSLNMTGNENYKILFYTDVYSMVPIQTVDKVIQIKPLAFIWEKFSEYNHTNTVICDEIKYNFYLNPKNGILINPYRYYYADYELVRLLSYLRFIAQSDDLSDLNHKSWKDEQNDRDDGYGSE
ncbi:hypothetical protein ILUMI_23126 [Ignelater luminosus]|uniref:FCP1 homology domain-containing protein n=1 Tax=Ignelater luminosus TaxID=2038154 RepID=A0A8K0G264_IGNLU|nr:hypothetical protein ILUMI_23126 [Ignelater luminosus]